jgi:hypothetical protein
MLIGGKMKSNLRQVQTGVRIDPDQAMDSGVPGRGIALDTFFNGLLIFFAVVFVAGAAAEELVHSGFEPAAGMQSTRTDGSKEFRTQTAREQWNVPVKASQQGDGRVYPANSAA